MSTTSGPCTAWPPLLHTTKTPRRRILTSDECKCVLWMPDTQKVTVRSFSAPWKLFRAQFPDMHVVYSSQGAANYQWIHYLKKGGSYFQRNSTWLISSALKRLPMFGALYQHWSPAHIKKKKEIQKERTKKYIFNDRTELEDCQRKEIGYKMTCHHGRGVTAKVNTAPLFISSPRFLNSITSSSLTYKHRTYFCVRHKKKSTNKCFRDSSSMVCCLSGWNLRMPFHANS